MTWTASALAAAVVGCGGRSLASPPAFAVAPAGTEWWCAGTLHIGYCFSSEQQCGEFRSSLGPADPASECAPTKSVVCASYQPAAATAEQTVCLSDLNSCNNFRASVLARPEGRVSECGMVLEAGLAACLPPVGTVPCSYSSECGGYRCAIDRCRFHCSSDVDCESGLVCKNGACVQPGECGTCSQDSQCGDYGCEISRHRCRTYCGSNYDCTLAVCVSGACVKPGTNGACRYDSDCGNYGCGSDHRCETYCSDNADCRYGRCRRGECR